MAENGVNGHRPSSGIQWKVGFMTDSHKYMTAESFGYKINASGGALKKKQVWIIEHEPSEQQKQETPEQQNTVYIRSHLGRYMSADRFGNVSVEAEEKGKNEQFVVEYSPDGKWAFKNIAHENYLSGTDEIVKCFDKTPKDKSWWSIQLYVHPHIHLRNVNRKRYAHLNKDKNVIECTEIIPWGADALLILDFVEGKYTLKTSDNRYLNRDGTLQDNIDADTMYTMEIRSGCLAFKDHEGRYLTGVGTGTVKGGRGAKGKSATVSKDELFTIEDSHPQLKITSHTGKVVSIKQGVDVSANQRKEEDLTDTEIFQLEFIKEKEKWAFRSCQGKYWSLQPDSGTVKITSCEIQGPSNLFTIEWQEDGSVGIIGDDGKYISNKATGILYSASSTLEDTNKFYFSIVNRPLLALKCDFGFVGIKGDNYVCNHAANKYSMLMLTSADDGSYTLKGSDGKFVCIGDDNIVCSEACSETSASKFQIQFHGQSLMAIRAPNGNYLNGEQNGNFKAVATEINQQSLWEY